MSIYHHKPNRLLQNEFTDKDRILKLYKDLGNLERAIIQLSQQKNSPYLREYAIDPRRAVGLRLLGDLKGKRILDYGCEWGIMGAAAAKMGAKVTFVDSDQQNLKLTQLRCHDECLESVEFISYQNWVKQNPNLSHFDIVLLNGSLDKISCIKDKNYQSNTEYKISLLKKLQRLITDGGILWIAAKNYWALPFLSPNTLSRALRWSLADYHYYLSKANLVIKEEYAIFPNYQFPQLITCLNDSPGLVEGLLLNSPWMSPLKNKILSLIKNPIIISLDRLGLLKNSVDSYIFIVTSNSSK